MQVRIPKAFAVIALSVLWFADAAGDGFDDWRAAASDAARDGDYARAESLTRRMLDARPNYPPALYNLAILATLQERHDEALASLARYAGLGLHTDPRAHPVLASLDDHAGFDALAERLEANGAPVVSSRVAFTFAEPDFIPEGLAYDPGRDAFLAGSVRHRKIVATGRDGAVTPFAPAGACGLGSVMAIAPDPARGRLWVASAMTAEMRPRDEAHEGRTGVWALSLDDGACITEHLLPAEYGEPAVIGDLAVLDDGRILVSESLHGGVYAFDPGSGGFEPLVARGALRSAQGIAPSADGSRVYVADYARGLHVLDTVNGTLRRLTLPDDAHDYWIDGLYWHDGDLVGIQNLSAPHRVVRFTLAADGVTVTGTEVLDAALPVYREPTVGTLVGDVLYYFANSQWDRFDDTRELPPIDDLTAPVILALPLKAATPQLANGAFEADLNGHRIHYAVHGTGPVLMTVPNSWGLSLDALRAMYRPLEDRVTMVYFDPRGMGGSSPVREDADMGMEAVRADFQALRGHLGLETVNAIGWSNGAANLIYLAHERPDTLDAAIFVHSGASYTAEDGRYLQETFPGIARAFGEFMTEVAGDDALTAEEKTAHLRTLYLDDYFPAISADPVPTHTLLTRTFADAEFSWPHSEYTQRTMPGFDARELLPGIGVRSLVIAGAHDVLPPEFIEPLADGLPDARFEVFEASGHFAPIEEPERFRDTVFAFLDVAADD